MRKLHIILSSLIGVVLVLLGIFVFGDSWVRALETLVDFGRSIGYYFCELFFIDHNISPTVKDKSKIFLLNFDFADNSGQFMQDARSYFLLPVCFSYYSSNTFIHSLRIFSLLNFSRVPS